MIIGFSVNIIAVVEGEVAVGRLEGYGQLREGGIVEELVDIPRFLAKMCFFVMVN
jgi:hypothetical protein